MTAHHLLNKLAAKDISRDEARVLVSLSTRGKTIAEITAESPGLCPKVPARMIGATLKRQKHGRSYIYRLTERGMHLARMIFDEETATTTTTTTTTTTADTPDLPFPQV